MPHIVKVKLYGYQCPRWVVRGKSNHPMDYYTTQDESSATRFPNEKEACRAVEAFGKRWKTWIMEVQK